MPMCRVFSCVVGRECLVWPVHSLGKTLLAFTLLHVWMWEKWVGSWKNFRIVNCLIPCCVVVHSVVSHYLWCHGVQYARLPWHVLHCLPKLAQNHFHWVSDAIQPSNPLSPPSPPALSLSQHQSLSQRISSSHQVAKVLELQHQSFHWIFRVALC